MLISPFSHPAACSYGHLFYERMQRTVNSYSHQHLQFLNDVLANVLVTQLLPANDQTFILKVNGKDIPEGTPYSGWVLEASECVTSALNQKQDNDDFTFISAFDSWIYWGKQLQLFSPGDEFGVKNGVVVIKCHKIPEFQPYS